LGAKIDGAISPKVRFFKLILAEAQAQVNHGLAPTHENLRGVINDVLSKTSSMMGKEANVSDADRETLTNLVGKHLNTGAALYPPTLKESSGFKQSPEQLAFVQGEYAKQMQEYESAKLAAMDGGNTVKYLAPRMSVEQTVKAIQANVKASGATSPEAIQAAVFDGFAGLSHPTPLNDSTLDKIADKLIVKQTHAPAATAPVKQFVGGTGIHNPALGTEEAHFPLPLPQGEENGADTRTVRATRSTSESRSSPCTVHAEGQGKPFTESRYEELKAMIVSREIEPTFRPVKTVLSGWEVGASDRNRQVIAAAALDRMHRENVLILNPANDGSGIQKAKYILA
jgi:hypothetical protein